MGEQEKHELDLYAYNTSELYGQHQSIVANLKRRIEKGTYDPALAPKLWGYWVEAAAKRYAKEFGGSWHAMFDKPTRDALAREIAVDEHRKIVDGEYGPVNVAGAMRVHEEAGAYQFTSESKRALKIAPVDLVVAVYGDGAVYGASSSPHASTPRYWMGLKMEGEPFALYAAHAVPKEVADRLEKQGVSGEQWYDDGYKAMRAAAPYMDAEPFYSTYENPARLAAENPLTRGEKIGFVIAGVAAFAAVGSLILNYSSRSAAAAIPAHGATPGIVTLAPGAMTATLSTTSSTTLALPAGATWGPGVTDDAGNSIAGSSVAYVIPPGVPSSFVMDVSWVDASGAPQTTTLTLTVA